VIGRLLSVDPTATVLGSLRVALNAVIAEVDASKLSAIAQDVEITRINGVVNYEMQAPPMETVPYIGATPVVQAAGFRGRDVNVAVLDSGIEAYRVRRRPDSLNQATLAWA